MTSQQTKTCILQTCTANVTRARSNLRLFVPTDPPSTGRESIANNSAGNRQRSQAITNIAGDRQRSHTKHTLTATSRQATGYVASPRTSSSISVSSSLLILSAAYAAFVASLAMQARLWLRLTARLVLRLVRALVPGSHVLRTCEIIYLQLCSSSQFAL